MLSSTPGTLVWLTSHSRAGPSPLAVTIVCPSGLKAAEMTPAVWRWGGRGQGKGSQGAGAGQPGPGFGPLLRIAGLYKQDNGRRRRQNRHHQRPLAGQAAWACSAGDRPPYTWSA